MKNDKVVEINCCTSLDVPVEKILKMAYEKGLSECVVIGYDQEGEFYFRGSMADGGAVLWLMEKAKAKLMAIAK